MKNKLWLECADCGEYQKIHDGPCTHCKGRHLILRTDDEKDPEMSAFWRKSHGMDPGKVYHPG